MHTTSSPFSRRILPLFRSHIIGVIVALWSFTGFRAMSEDAGDTADAIRQAVRARIVELVDDGASGNVNIELFGRVTRVAIDGASDDGLEVVLDDDFLDVEWDSINDMRLAGILQTLGGDSLTGDDRVNAGILIRLSGDRDTGNRLIAGAIRDNPDQAKSLTAKKEAVFGKEKPVTIGLENLGEGVKKSTRPTASRRTLPGPGGATYSLSHPRLFMRADKINGSDIETPDEFRKNGSTGRRGKFKSLLNDPECPQHVGVLAAKYILNGDKSAADKAINLLVKPAGDMGWYHIGDWLIPRAVAYDWLYNYPGFTDEYKTRAREIILKGQKAAMGWIGSGRHLGTNASLLPFGAAMCATIALYGESPGMESDLKKLEKMLDTDIPGIFEEYDGGWSEGWSYFQTAARPLVLALDAYRSFSGRDLWRIEVNGHYPYLQFIKGLLWGLRPDQSFVRWGDIVDGGKATTLEHVCFFLLPAIRSTQDPELAWYLQLVEQKRGRRAYWEGYAFLGVLIGTNKIPQGKQPTVLSNLMGKNSLGQVVMRSGWGENDTFVSFICGDYQGPIHADWDTGSFTVFCKGGLVIDSGKYAKIGSPHYANYKKKAVAHNVILAGEPGETGDEGDMRNPSQHTLYTIADVKNPGDCDMGDIIAYQDAGSYVYVAGNASRAFKGGIKKWTRELVYIRPNILVICDRVESNASKEKRFLLHTITEPTVTGNRISVQNGGYLEVISLLPAQAHIRVIGGPGKRYWAKGRNWPVKPSADDQSGAWRAEIYQPPGSGSQTFLTVMTFGPSKVPCQATLLNGTLGVTINSRRVVFSSPGNVSVK